jgi:hypothetical protein
MIYIYLTYNLTMAYKILQKFKTLNYLNNANEYRRKAKNNQSIIQLNGISTILFT